MKNRTNNKKPRTRVEPKQEPLISSLTEDQQIAMGFRNPRVVKPDFSKSKEERAKWKKVHSNAKGPTGGMPTPPANELAHNLIVHYTPKGNDKNEADPSKTTQCFKAKPSEVNYILRTFFSNNITKIWYRGQQLAV